MPPTTPANGRCFPIWGVALFGLLFLVNAWLVMGMFRLNGWGRDEGGPGDPRMLAALAISIASTAVPLAGLVATLRRASARLLVPAGLLSVAWPGFVLYVILHFPNC